MTVRHDPLDAQLWIGKQGFEVFFFRGRWKIGEEVLAGHGAVPGEDWNSMPLIAAEGKRLRRDESLLGIGGFFGYPGAL